MCVCVCVCVINRIIDSVEKSSRLFGPQSEITVKPSTNLTNLILKSNL